MTCRSITDKLYDSFGEKQVPLLARIEIALHVIICPQCAGTIARLAAVREFMQTGFLPASPALEDSIMERIYAEISEAADMPLEDAAPSPEISFRSWVVTGIIVLVSLPVSFFGLDFGRVAASNGLSFLLPVGITIGAVVTGYGAIFIGSHLKELSDRFGLH
jgi:hypothetical protein